MKYQAAMLANVADTATVQRLIDSNLWSAEQKIDGDRCLLHIEGGKIAPVARSGILLDRFKAPAYAPWKEFIESDTRWVFDGEYLNGCYYIFDLIEAGTLISPSMLLEQRRDALERFYSQWNPASSAVELLPAYRDATGKQRLVDRVKEIGGEGVMFKRLDSRYMPGKRCDSLLKLKFRNDIDCVVMALGIDGKNNMSLGCYDDTGTLVEVAECTALAGDGPRIKAGDVVKVIYLYASLTSRLVQPTKPMLRHDKLATDCTLDQMVYVNKTVLTGA